MDTLAKHVVVITGSDSGIGRATAIELAREGAGIAVNYLDDEEGARKTKQKCEEAGGKAAAIQADISKEADVEKLFDATRDELGPATILVNNAATDSSGANVADMDLKDWQKSIDVNLTGPFLCCRRFLRDLKQSGKRGKIINITSVHEDIPRAGAADYCAAKGGLRNLTRCLTLELAAEHVNVVNVAPGMVMTPFNKEAMEDPEVYKEQVQSIPWKRAAEPEEVAKLIKYLVSDDADYVAGVTFIIDGGLMQNLGQGA